MSTKAVDAELTSILESCEGTADFLEAVKRALETLYSESEFSCAAVVAALDTAIEAARADDEYQS